MRTIGIALAIVLLGTKGGLAHGDGLPGAAPAWTFDPWIVLPLLASGLLYALGAQTLFRRSRDAHGSRGWHHVAYLLGWLTLATALVSPLHWLGERLFSFHMIEHEIVMAISAPLIVVARPLGTLMWSFPRRLRLALARLLRSRAIRMTWDWASNGRNATVLHGVAIWAWHAPPLFDAAVTNLTIHRLQHLSFFVTAVLFWWSVFRRSESGAGAWHLFITMLHTSALGALMTLAPRVLYQAQTATSSNWGFTPLQDQQLAGLIMWVPAGTIYAGAALALMAVWISRSGPDGRDGRAAAPAL
jgi:cytochrome c oxidase assembly factor CtaG